MTFNTIRLSGGEVLNWGTVARVEIGRRWSGRTSTWKERSPCPTAPGILAGNSMTLGTGDSLAAGNFAVELSSMNLVEGGEGLASIIMTGGA
ncbi:MAG: hypothetical protein ACLT8E_02115 [Akkermansia sp.]